MATSDCECVDGKKGRAKRQRARPGSASSRRLLHLAIGTPCGLPMQAKLASELLGAAQTHLPALGFTLEAVQAGARQRGLAESTTVASLFASHTDTARSLLARFDEEHWVHVVKQQHGTRAEAVAMLESKLVSTGPVKEKLPDALAALVASPLSAVPNPSPLMHRAYSIADEALHRAGWTGDLSTDWYTTRFGLSVSYLIAELHMVSPDQQDSNDVAPSLQFFRRLSSPLAHNAPQNQTDFPAVDRWARWGSQGWLGILRSHGL